MVGTYDILKRSFQVWHTCLSSCQPNFDTEKMMFFRYDNEHTLQPDHHVVVMQSNVDVNKINSNFQVFSKLQRLHCLTCGKSGPQ